MDPRLTVLLGVYAAILVLNVFISWMQRKHGGDNPATKAQVVFWVTGIVLYVFQGLHQDLDAWLVVMLLPVTVLSFALARLAETFLGVRAQTVRRYVPWIAASGALSLVLFLMHAPFIIAATPLTIGTQAPLFPVVWQGFRRWRQIRFAERMFLSGLAFDVLLELTYPIIRPNPDLTLLGFTLGFSLLVVFSILVPMLVNESLLRGHKEILEREVALRTRQLLESAKFASIGRMAGGVAHEMNSPLAAIQGYAASLNEAAARRQISEAEVARSSEKILEVIQRIARITGSLRLISRETTVGQREVVRVNQVVDGAVAVLADQIGRNEVQLRVNVDPACPTIRVSLTEIAQVLVILLANSIEALQKSTTQRWVQIAAAPEPDGGLAVAVTDAGRMSPDVGDRIMDPFFTTKPLGVGWGLTVARGIAEAHGGSLRFDRDRENTTFVLRLPAAAP